MRKITNLDEMREIELGIMKDVHAFCVKHHIRYYLSHGTLIGAIRHNGFIPWDDDIDIFMPRNDYSRFCKLFTDSENEFHLKLVNHRTKPYFGRAMSKVIDTRTVLTETDFRGDDPIGVFVDIWPLDGVPNSTILRYLYFKICKFINGLIYTKIGLNANKIKKIMLVIISSRILVSVLDKIIQVCDYEKCKEITCMVDPYNAIMDKEIFSKSKLHKFEDSYFYVPENYHKLLSLLYGDYMKLPPKEKRIPHHIVNTFWKQ